MRQILQSVTQPNVHSIFVINNALITLICVTESGDIKASVAVLSFIFSSAAKHDVDSESLSSELQQLGLPKGGFTGLLHVWYKSFEYVAYSVVTHRHKSLSMLHFMVRLVIKDEQR